ncbi:MAG: hypothetical protein HY701_09660 [Gemmatimonadetes bacterium]|nr:hypothetical protein [Gemmatimonadota bacterium]
MALVGALSPLGKVAHRGSRWALGVTAYSLAGVIASAAVGLAIGFLGQGLPSPVILALAAGASIGTAVAALIGRRVPIPELRRQTDSRWAKRFPAPAAALLWGIDLGLVFSTRITLVGTWILALVALAAGPAFAAVLFASHWVGRALSVWLAPGMMRHAADGPALLEQIDARRADLLRAHAVGLASTAVVTIVWLAHTIGR